MMYSEFIKINPLFQSSINLQFDLNDENKIKQYIPTREACGILSTYISSIINPKEKATRASVLYGPYGKGKSFLVLVLLYLVSADCSSSVYQELLKKIEEVDESLSSQIKILNKNSIRLLPVIVNSDYDDLDQAFLIGLAEAKNREHLGDVVPKTGFDVAMEVLDQWKHSDVTNSILIEACRKRKCLSFKALQKGLRDNNLQSYKTFCDFYQCVSGGIPFNPLIRKNAASSLKTVAENISGKFTGVFVVFDEFSKFIESGVAGLSQQLKTLQDAFEMATRSREKSQIHICCINHKKLSTYTKSISSENINSFRTIEGRVKEISFTRTMGENYWIISKALVKGPAFDQFWKQYSSSHSAVLDWYVSKGFVDDETKDDLLKGCFPLNPLAAYSLIQLSEVVAQNERTLFTFIADNDANSLNSFIHNQCERTYQVDSLFDYFKTMMGKEEGEIKDIWMKAEAILDQLVLDEERSIVKAIAISQILKDNRLFPATIEFLSKAVDCVEIERVLDTLVSKSLLSKDFLTNQYSLSTYSNKEISQAISDYQASHRTLNLFAEFNRLSPVRYIPARRYNTEYKMIRYYRTVYLSEDSFLSMASLDNTCEEPCDGVIYQVVRENRSIKEISDVYKTKKRSERVVVGISKNTVTSKTLEMISRYVALEAICKSDYKINPVLLSEMEMLKNEYKVSIKSILKGMYDESVWIADINASKLSDIMTQQLEQSFTKSPIINNELLNKHELSSVYKKARNSVIADVLDNGTSSFDGYSETSAEQTIFQSVFNAGQNGIDQAVLAVETTFHDYENVKVSFKRISELLVKPPFGMREGVIPLVIAAAIYDLPDHFVMSYSGKEIPFDASNLSKALEKPSDYSFKVIKGAREKNRFLEAFAQGFGVSITHHFWKDLSCVVEVTNKYVSMLPIVVRSGNIDELVGIDGATRKFVNAFLKFDINCYETIFITLPEIYGFKNDGCYEQLLGKVMASKAILDSAFSRYQTFVSNQIKNCFEAKNEESLKSSIASWVLEKSISISAKNSMRLNEQKLFEVITSDKVSFHDADAVNLIAKVATGMMIADWQNEKTSEVIGLLRSLKEKAENYKSFSDKKEKTEPLIELSVMGEIAKRSLRAAMDEYGESISVEEKVAILKSMMKELQS